MSDMFAFSMTCYQTFTNKSPFFEEYNDDVVQDWIKQGKRPTKLQSIPDRVWSLMERGWVANPKDRITFSEVAVELDMIASFIPSLVSQNIKPPFQITYYYNQKPVSGVHTELSGSTKISLSDAKHHAHEINPIQQIDVTAKEPENTHSLINTSFLHLSAGCGQNTKESKAAHRAVRSFAGFPQSTDCQGEELIESKQSVRKSISGPHLMAPSEPNVDQIPLPALDQKFDVNNDTVIAVTEHSMPSHSLIDFQHKPVKGAWILTKSRKMTIAGCLGCILLAIIVPLAIIMSRKTPTSPTIIAENLDIGDPVFLNGLNGGYSIRNYSNISVFAGDGSKGSADGNANTTSFDNPSSIAIDSKGNLFVSDPDAGRIRKIGPDGIVSTVVSGIVAMGLCICRQTKDIYAVGTGVYIIPANGGPVKSFAGLNAFGKSDGTFGHLDGITDDYDGNFVVVDSIKNQLFKISPSGHVSIFAGSGNAGSSDGMGIKASFNGPRGITIDGSGNFYVTDTQNNVVRKITPNGSVSTLLRLAPIVNPDFLFPRGIVVDPLDNLYIADTVGGKVKRILSNTMLNTLAGDPQSIDCSLKSPSGIAVNRQGEIFVTDNGNHRIQKLS